jgi:hypothetical protein
MNGKKEGILLRLLRECISCCDNDRDVLAKAFEDAKAKFPIYEKDVGDGECEFREKDGDHLAGYDSIESIMEWVESVFGKSGVRQGCEASAR